MCEATVLATAADGEHVLMRAVMQVRPEGDLLLLSSLLGEQSEDASRRSTCSSIAST